MTEFEMKMLIIGLALGACTDRLLVLIPQYRRQAERRKRNADKPL